MENRTNAIEDSVGRQGFIPDEGEMQRSFDRLRAGYGHPDVCGAGRDSRFPFDSPDAAVSLRAGSSLWPGGAASGNGRIVYIFFCGSWLSHDSLDPSRRSG